MEELFPKEDDEPNRPRIVQIHQAWELWVKSLRG